MSDNTLSCEKKKEEKKLLHCYAILKAKDTCTREMVKRGKKDAGTSCVMEKHTKMIAPCTEEEIQIQYTTE